jgi:hypothetical protein
VYYSKTILGRLLLIKGDGGVGNPLILKKEYVGSL